MEISMKSFHEISMDIELDRITMMDGGWATPLKNMKVNWDD